MIVSALIFFVIFKFAGMGVLAIGGDVEGLLGKTMALQVLDG